MTIHRKREMPGLLARALSGRRMTAGLAAAGVVVLATGWPTRALAAVTITDLATLPGGTVSIAEAINDRGTIIGDSQVASGTPRAVSWDSQGAITEFCPATRSARLTGSARTARSSVRPEPFRVSGPRSSGIVTARSPPWPPCPATPIAVPRPSATAA
jgi:glycine cleavage system aminomethyltransferase T